MTTRGHTIGTWGLEPMSTLPSFSGMGTVSGASVIFGKARCSGLGSRAGRAGCCVLGHDHATLPSRQSHPCDSLSSQETWHDPCEIKISRSAHSRLQPAESWDSRRGFWVLGPSRWACQLQWSPGQTQHCKETPGGRFAMASKSCLSGKRAPRPPDLPTSSLCLVFTSGIDRLMGIVVSLNQSLCWKL